MSFADTFTERPAGDSVGTMTLELQVSGDSVVSIIKGLYHDSVSQHAVAIFDRPSLRLRDVRDSTSAERESLHYVGDRLRGTRVIANRRGTFDTFYVNIPVDSVTVDRRSLLGAVPWLPLEAGRVVTLRIFDPSFRTVYPLRITIGDKAPITVPAGTFEVYRLVLTARPPKWVGPSQGLLFPTVLWVRADSSRRIVRIERPHLGVVYELTKDQPAR